MLKPQINAYEIASLRLILDRAGRTDWTFKLRGAPENRLIAFRNPDQVTMLFLERRPWENQWLTAIPVANNKWREAKHANQETALAEALLWIQQNPEQHSAKPWPGRTGDGNDERRKHRKSP